MEQNNFEIERRFLVPILPLHLPFGKKIHQYYLTMLDGMAIRIRFENGILKYITFKKSVRKGINFEKEYRIEGEEGDNLLEVLRPLVAAGLPEIKKIRYEIPWHNGLVLEVDSIMVEGGYFVIAEIEVPYLEADIGPLPPWIGKEVTGDKRYSNASIAKFGIPK